MWNSKKYNLSRDKILKWSKRRLIGISQPIFMYEISSKANFWRFKELLMDGTKTTRMKIFRTLKRAH